jgi:hypothetical protein
MFNRLFGKKSGRAASDKNGPDLQLAMPLLRSLNVLTPEKVAHAWATLFPSMAIIPDGDVDGPWKFESGDQSVFAMPISMPVPKGDIEGACERSWMWKDAAEATKGQRVHFIVTSMQTDNAVAAAMMVSRVCGAIMRAAGSDAVGVYWGNCSQVHQPRMFVEVVKSFDGSDGSLPAMLWIGLMISARSRQGPFTLTTCGLRAFGHKEFEVIDAHIGVGDLRMMIVEMANYVLTKGPVLLHGETFGPDENTKWEIEHTASRFRGGEGVIRLHVQPGNDRSLSLGR